MFSFLYSSQAITLYIFVNNKIFQDKIFGIGCSQQVEGIRARADLISQCEFAPFFIVVWVSLVSRFLGGVTPPPSWQSNELIMIINILLI